MLKFQRNVFGNKGIWQNSNFRRRGRRKLLAVFLCLSMMAAFLPGTAAEAEEEERLSGIVEFQSITLHYAKADGLPEETAIEEHVLLEKDRKLALRYEYEITGEQCSIIQADTNYYLEVSPHLVLPDLGNAGSELTIMTEEGPRRFGAIFADGVRAWVVFDASEEGSGTVLAEYGELQDAFFYLNCGRAGQPPEGETPVDGKNLYVMKFENGETLKFGYAEREPVEAQAQVKKSGSLNGKTIAWTIQYTPWQNPAGGDLTMETEFELRDVIDSSLHSYAAGSAKIDGTELAAYHSREEITGEEEAYVLEEASDEDGSVQLSFGGRKFRAGAAAQGAPAQALTLTYETVIKDELLLPGGKGGQKVTNGVELFAETDGEFQGLNISSSQTVAVPQPVWLTKKGTTTRYDDGTGSATDWTVTFFPNGFSFSEDHSLTFHDQLPAGSTLDADSVKINGASAAVLEDGQNGFTVSPIVTEHETVILTYQTRVPEEMYDSGTNLGNNVAWFTFHYNEKDYEAPKVTTPVDSGDGSGMPGTATLVKSNRGYNASLRTIDWTVTINPHKAYLKSGTFTDDFREIGGVCSEKGHSSGLELAGDPDGISVLINNQEPAEDEKDLVKADYKDQVLTITAGEVGAKTITIAYKTKVCDPCIFANNTSRKQLKNIVSTEDMLIGKNTTAARSAKAESAVSVNAVVLTKKTPIYDYTAGKMKWTVEVDAAGLPMEEVMLTDDLPKGLTYAEDSLETLPVIAGASAEAQGQELTINLGNVTEKTTVTFDTEVDPEKTGFSSNEAVRISNTIVMNGIADSVPFGKVSHSVSGNFVNHGLVKSSSVDQPKELIQYEVLINPYGLALSECPSLVDTLDKRLQVDLDTLRFYKARLSGTTGNGGQKPNYQKEGDGFSLQAENYDLESNSFTVKLPIEAGSRNAYVLTYTADIMKRQAGNYGNSVRFEGGAVLLGGSKNNSASVGGGGGGGGGGVAARKAGIAVTKTDSDNQKPLAGVSFTLYQWDNDNHKRGLPFARGTTDAQGKLSFLVKPGAVYELTETESLPGYENTIGWTHLPDGVTETAQGLLLTAGAAKSELQLDLTNEAYKTEEQQWTLTVHKVISGSKAPLAGAVFELYEEEECRTLVQRGVSGQAGEISFSGLDKGKEYWLKETEAPPDYQLDTSVYKVHETDPVLTVSNTPKQPPVTPEPPETDSGSPEGSDTPENPDDSGNPGNPEDTEKPENPGDSEEPENTDDSGNPGDSENPGGSEGPGNSGDSESPGNTGDSETSESSQNPEAPGESGNPGNSGDSENPGNTGDSENPGSSQNPENSGESGNPGDLENPDNSGNPGNSGDSESPGNSGNPGGSEKPENPGSSENPGDAEKPEGPGNSEIPGASENPDNFKTPNASGEQKISWQPGDSGTDADTPKTGDDTVWLEAVVLLSGTVLAMMTLYYVWREKKRERK